MTQADIQETGGPSTATLRLIEGGKHTEFRSSTSGPLEKALQWEPGSIDSILAGGNPTPLSPTIGGVGITPSVGMRGVVVQPGPAELTITGGQPIGGQTPDSATRSSSADRRSEESPTYHVPDFLTVAKMTWAMVAELADSPEGDPDRDVKAARAVVSTADTLTDALLRLHVGPAARELIQEMAYQSHQVMRDQGRALRHHEDPVTEAESDEPDRRRKVDIAFPLERVKVSVPPADDPFGPSSLDLFLAEELPERLREIFQDLGRVDPSLDLSSELDKAQVNVAALPAGPEQRAARMSEFQKVLSESIRRSEPVVAAGDAAPRAIEELQRMLESLQPVGPSPLDQLDKHFRLKTRSREQA
jgi:hypothetical protein